jgi:hypothetical protein
MWINRVDAVLWFAHSAPRRLLEALSLTTLSVPDGELPKTCVRRPFSESGFWKPPYEESQNYDSSLMTAAVRALIGQPSM